MTINLRRRPNEYTDFHLFCGLGGGALGFSRAHVRLGHVDATFRHLGGIDSDPAACRDYEQLTGGRATCLDLFTWGQYVDFHGEAPPDGWREATADDVRQAAGGEHPDVVFTSPPCKGFSGLLNQRSAASRKYQALNRLTIRSIELILEAWADLPPRLILLENVPRIQSRGAGLLDAIKALLESHGYAVAFRPTYDCGELGGLGQHRERFLLVARHQVRVPALLYRPTRQGLRTVGDVVGPLPMPDDPAAGPMHRLPRIQWKTAVRLALIEAGSDWRSLQDLEVVDGYVRGLALEPMDYGHELGAVPDPRCPDWRNQTTGRVHAFGQYGVRPWDQAAATVTSKAHPGAGPYSVADPRVADVLPIPDPRVGCKTVGGQYASARHYGVIPWSGQSQAVIGRAKHDNGAFSVADPRPLFAPTDQPDPLPRIVSLDGTWHRPLTTLELAALQGFPVLPTDGAPLVLDGRAHTHWRQRVGNAVPPPAAQAIAETMLQTLVLSDTGHTVDLLDVPVWVRSLAIALSVDTRQGAIA